MIKEVKEIIVVGLYFLLSFLYDNRFIFIILNVFNSLCFYNMWLMRIWIEKVVDLYFFIVLVFFSWFSWIMLLIFLESLNYSSC